MHYVLFIPCDDSEKSVEQVLTEVGCSHLAEGVQSTRINNGPDGKSGLQFCWMANNGQVHNIQPTEWIPALPNDTEELDAGRYYIGVDVGNLPTPKDLQRRYPYSGESILMGDDHEWIIPRERELPFDIVHADDGSLKFEPQRRFHEMHILSGTWRNAFEVAMSGQTFIEKELSEYVDFALRINYRTLPELTFDVLRLYSAGRERGTVHPALRAALTAATSIPLEVSHG